MKPVWVPDLHDSAEGGLFLTSQIPHFSINDGGEVVVVNSQELLEVS